MLCAINRFKKNCFWVPRDSGDLQNFLKNPKVSDLTPGRANIDFYTKLVWCPKLAGARVRSDSNQLQKKMVLMVAIPNFFTLFEVVFLDII